MSFICAALVLLQLRKCKVWRECRPDYSYQRPARSTQRTEKRYLWFSRPRWCVQGKASRAGLLTMTCCHCSSHLGNSHVITTKAGRRQFFALANFNIYAPVARHTKSFGTREPRKKNGFYVPWRLRSRRSPRPSWPSHFSKSQPRPLVQSIGDGHSSPSQKKLSGVQIEFTQTIFSIFWCVMT